MSVHFILTVPNAKRKNLGIFKRFRMIKKVKRRTCPPKRERMAALYLLVDVGNLFTIAGRMKCGVTLKNTDGG